MDGQIGSLDFEACETCENWNSDTGDCLVNGPDIEIEMGDWVICESYEEGKPKTDEEIEHRKEAMKDRERQEDIDRYQKKWNL